MGQWEVNFRGQRADGMNYKSLAGSYYHLVVNRHQNAVLAPSTQTIKYTPGFPAVHLLCPICHQTWLVWSWGGSISRNTFSSSHGEQQQQWWNVGTLKYSTDFQDCTQDVWASVLSIEKWLMGCCFFSNSIKQPHLSILNFRVFSSSAFYPATTLFLSK